MCDKSSLSDFFADADSRTCVIHCAGIVSVASRPGPRLYQVNVGGTWKVLRQCMEHDVGKMVYVSSVHAIPEKPKGCIISEDCEFSPGLVDGDYAKSKAAATIFKNAGVEIFSVWLETTTLNFPMALCWQLFFAGPIVRFIFRHIFRRSLTADNTH